MEEITTRFEIIRLAVQLGDFRTIDLQCEKLRALSLDEKLNEIIDLVESRNYRQALYEMKHYARSLEDEFFAEKSSPSATRAARQSPEPQKDLGLFALPESDESEEDEEERVLDLDDILNLSRQKRVPQSREYQPAPEFEISQTPPRSPESPKPSIEAEPPNEPETSETPEVEAFKEELLSRKPEVKRPEASQDEAAPILQESQGGSGEPEAPSVSEPEALHHPHTDRHVQDQDEVPAQEARQEHQSSPAKATTPSPSAPTGKRFGEDEGATRYPPISYISQKFRNMIHQFPPVENEGEIPEEVEAMQKKISQEGYTEEEIEAFLQRYRTYKEEGRRYEAALVLLLAAATESKFAQFMLARELFRGEILRQDHAEAFTQINTLADQNFAEAICDLGQFYEHGVGISKDRQMALLLYEEAAEMGVARARNHYERLKSGSGLFGVFKKVSLPKVNIPLPKKGR